MIDDAAEKPWLVLPGSKWDTPLQAKTWLIEQRRLLGWSHKDVAEAFLECAVRSDLYIGPGGGDRFDRATEKRVARFERESQHIPDLVYWLPLGATVRLSPWSGRGRLSASLWASQQPQCLKNQAFTK